MTSLQAGLVVALEANRPTVETITGERYLCYLRGRLKQEVGRIMVGDRVQVVPADPGEGLIVGVDPRDTTLLRPPLANVTGLWAIFSLVQPRGSRALLDKRLVMAALGGMEAEVVVNKSDLAGPDAVAALVRVYQAAGYPVWEVSAANGDGLSALLDRRRQGVWVLTGESGVGKSSLLNALLPAARVEQAGLGRHQRGLQTTRQVRLWRLQDFWLADTPGYTALSMNHKDARAIQAAFPEFHQHECRYADCWHRQEPHCGVRGAVEAGLIDAERYRNYCLIVDQWVSKKW